MLSDDDYELNRNTFYQYMQLFPPHIRRMCLEGIS